MTLVIPPEGGSKIPCTLPDAGAPSGLEWAGPSKSRVLTSRLARLLFSVLATIALALLALPALAASRPELCEASAREAAAAHDVPLPVLRAAMLASSGRNRDDRKVPWPWTVTAGTETVWFETADDARAFAYQQIKARTDRIGIGCFQLDHAMEGGHFLSLEMMMTPRDNALHAAAILAERHHSVPDWTRAVAALHYGPPEETDTFLVRYARQYPQARTGPYSTMADSDTPTAKRPRINTYPLLQEGPAASAMGSLVPMTPSPQGPGLFRAAGGL